MNTPASKLLPTTIANNDDPHLGESSGQRDADRRTQNLRQLVAERNENKRMATTMVATTITDQIAYIANVGDSRGYHWRGNSLRQVTKDQSLVAKLVEEGAITEAEAANHPHRNVILYSIGSEKTPQIELFEVNLDPGDKIFMCSDGLDATCCGSRNQRYPREKRSLDAAANHLIQLANERGGQDNISAAIIDFGKSLADTVIEESAPRVAMPVVRCQMSDGSS